MSNLRIDIVSAEGHIHSGSAAMVIAPAEMGEIGIAPRHAPLFTHLRAGQIQVKDEAGMESSFYVSGGLIEVQPFQVTVLADTALRAEDLDEAAALEAKRRAEEALANQHDDVDMAEVQAELLQAVAQIRMVQQLKKRR